jgi:hypothetical protein
LRIPDIYDKLKHVGHLGVTLIKQLKSAPANPGGHASAIEVN